MSAGLQPTKAELDSAMGSMLRDIRINLSRASLFKIWLDSQIDSDLTSLGYSAGDISSIRSAFTDADKLNNIFLGTQTQATVYDFRSFIKRLWGTGGAY